MHEITGATKYKDGIEVEFWTGDEYHTDFFTYGDLVDQKINALDVLENPGNYSLDDDQHRIIEKIP